MQLFTCADSIRSGSDWQATIRQYLAETEVFLSVASEPANRSVFCAFESGFAQAREIPVHIVDLDGGGPPSHLSHLQAKVSPATLRATLAHDQGGHVGLLLVGDHSVVKLKSPL